MTEGGEEGEATHIHEDYWNHPYQPPTLTPDQQKQIEEDFAFMTRKEVYPYEYMDSFERFQEPQLPPKEVFYSSLMEEDISEIDNTNAERVFNHFGMTDLEDYHNFYLLTGVLLLANVLENFKDVCLQYYGLDLAYNYTSPGLSRQAVLKMMDVELDLLTNIDQHLFIKDVISGGVEMISHQYTPASALWMENYDASKRNRYIKYLDANNLYGWVMSQPLPRSNFKSLTDEEMEVLDVIMISDDSWSRYVLECGLGKYYFYFLSAYVYFIKCNISLLCISE